MNVTKAIAALQISAREREIFLEHRFGEEYLSYQYIFVEFFMEHLSETSRAFKGDLQQMLVLALIGQVHLRWRRDCEKRGIAPSSEIPPAASISASRLADCTGIPRETVRRKLVLLQKQGWVDRRPDGRWIMKSLPGTTEARARSDFSDIDTAARRRIARLVARLEDLADRGCA